MEYVKYIMSGEDKKTLITAKSILSASGYLFLGCPKDPSGILRCIRSTSPDLVIFDINGDFSSLRPVLEVLDDELLSACLLLLNNKDDEIMEFMNKARVVTFIAKPLQHETLTQIADISVMNFKRILEYEQKIKKLNDTLESRKAVEKAKWILVKQEGLSESDAYDVIRKKSRDNRISMRDIAEAIILTRGDTA